MLTAQQELKYDYHRLYQTQYQRTYNPKFFSGGYAPDPLDAPQQLSLSPILLPLSNYLTQQRVALWLYVLA